MKFHRRDHWAATVGNLRQKAHDYDYLTEETIFPCFSRSQSSSVGSSQRNEASTLNRSVSRSEFSEQLSNREKDVAFFYYSHRSCPAVSQSWMAIRFPSNSNCLFWKSTPNVELMFETNLFLQRRMIKVLFPTAASPQKTTLYIRLGKIDQSSKIVDLISFLLERKI